MSDDAHEDENRFSQDDDDRAGRSWPGMTSEIELDIGRFEKADDEDEPDSQPDQTDRV